MTAVVTTERSSPTFFGHPRGLVVCFSTELWERFSYYGMRALLVFYLTQHFLFSDKQAFLIYGAYTALIYMMPVIGGILSDRYLGARKSVCFGAILLVLGHFGMAFEGPEAVSSNGEVVRNAVYLQVFYLSLALIIMGVGFLKANICTIVGALYEQGDARRDSGFTLFYMGINIGAFFSALLCGWLGQTYGWSYGFGLAGLGMLFGLLVFLRGQNLLEGHAEPPDAALLAQPVFVGLSREILVYCGGLGGVLIVWQMIQHQALVGDLLMGAGGIMLAVILVFSFFYCSPIERDKMLTASVLIIFSVIFWALFEQAGSSLNLFADRVIDRSFFGWEIPASMFQSLNSFFIFIFAPLFSIMWLALAKRGIEPSIPVKFALAIFQVGLGFLVVVFGVSTFGSDGKAGMIWLVLIYLLHTTGELCLSPVGLSMITKLSVSRVVGMMMGVWFMALAGANYIGGLIAGFTGTTTEKAVVDQVHATAKVLDVYASVGWLAIGVSVLLLLISPLLRKGMHGVR